MPVEPCHYCGGLTEHFAACPKDPRNRSGVDRLILRFSNWVRMRFAPWAATVQHRVDHTAWLPSIIKTPKPPQKRP